MNQSKHSAVQTESATGSVSSKSASPNRSDGSSFRLGRWLLGWIIIPCSVLLAIFGVGVHLGARRPDIWPLEVVRWIIQTAQSIFG